MIADSTDELLAMVDMIQVDRKHIQFRGLAKEHFDISAERRDWAIAAGAIPVSSREFVRRMQERSK